jgi:hypothetical protein
MMPVPLVSVRNCEPHAAAAVIHHLGHRAAPRADLGDDDALEFFGDVNHEIFDRLHQLAVDLFRDDHRPRHLQLESLAAHHLDEDGELQLAAAEHFHLLGRVGRFDLD